MHYVALLLGVLIPNVVHAHLSNVTGVGHIVTAVRDEVSARARRPGPDAGCASKTEWQSSTHRVRDAVRELVWSRRGCRIGMRIEGDVGFNSDLTIINHIGRGGEVRIEQRAGSRRELRLALRRDGKVGVSYRVNGRSRQLDADGRAWMGEMIQLLLRTTGIEAERRVAHLLRQGGHDAVLAELSHLAGGHVQRRYLAELMTQTRLNGAAYAATMRAASETIASDDEWARFMEETRSRSASANGTPRRGAR